MKISGKMCLKIILQVTKNQGFTLSLQDTFFEKPQGGGGVKLTLPAILGLSWNSLGLIWSNLVKQKIITMKLTGLMTIFNTWFFLFYFIYLSVLVLDGFFIWTWYLISKRREKIQGRDKGKFIKLGVTQKGEQYIWGASFTTYATHFLFFKS